MLENVVDTTTSDGGYYAIKGFVFQFDKSILEALKNPTDDIEIEQIQDITTATYYIQVKYKEAQKYAPSKVRPAILQLLEESSRNTSRKYSLYCFFNNKLPGAHRLTYGELNTILGKEKNNYSETQKNNFLKVFTLQFADNFEVQFNTLIKQIKESFSLKSTEEAVMYHTNFRGHLLDIAIYKDRRKRKFNFSFLEKVLNNHEQIVFEIAYSKYLTKNKYLTYIKKQYFTHQKINIKDSERLFIVHVDNKISNTELIQIITNLSNKYYSRDNSGAPYIYLSNIENDRYVVLKQNIWNKGLPFSDGTHFSQDIFRIAYLTERFHLLPHNNIKCKLIDSKNLNEVLKQHTFDDIYLFLNPNSTEALDIKQSVKKFYIDQTRDILKVIN